jgi:ERI1 exoribonuclease 2
MEEDRWIDYQAVFGKRYDFTRLVSLKETLIYCNIDVEGRLHDGLDDAINTSKIIKLLETDKEFALYEYEREEVEEHPILNFCLGDLFANLQFECFA